MKLEISAESIVKSDLTSSATVDLRALRDRRLETTIVSPARRLLHKRFPLAFMTFEAPKRPLMIGIRESVMVAAPELCRYMVNRAIADYVGGRTYLRAMIEGAPRIDLHGKPSGQFVTAREAIFSAARLKKLNEAYGS